MSHQHSTNLKGEEGLIGQQSVVLPTPEEAVQRLSNTLDEVKASHSFTPSVVVVNGETYTQVDQTDKMVDTKGNEYSSGNFLKTVAPDIYKRSWGRLEDPPDGLLKVGLTSRNRIIKTVQLHLIKPIITPLTKPSHHTIAA